MVGQARCIGSTEEVGPNLPQPCPLRDGVQITWAGGKELVVFGPMQANHTFKTRNMNYIMLLTMPLRMNRSVPFDGLIPFSWKCVMRCDMLTASLSFILLKLRWFFNRSTWSSVREGKFKNLFTSWITDERSWKHEQGSSHSKTLQRNSLGGKLIVSYILALKKS